MLIHDEKSAKEAALTERIAIEDVRRGRNDDERVWWCGTQGRRGREMKKHGVCGCF